MGHDETTIRAMVTRRWQDIVPEDAVNINLSLDLSITAPLNEMGERCPWPWEPQQLVGVPMGLYHCQFCGAMVMAGLPHFDYTPEERVVTEDNAQEIAEWMGGINSGHGMVTLDQLGEILNARPGATVRRDEYGIFTIIDFNGDNQ